MTDFCNGYYKRVMRDKEEDKKNGQIFLVHELKELVLLKYPCYLKQLLIQCHLQQKSKGILYKTRRISKFHMKVQNTLES